MYEVQQQYVGTLTLSEGKQKFNREIQLQVLRIRIIIRVLAVVLTSRLCANPSRVVQRVRCGTQLSGSSNLKRQQQAVRRMYVGATMVLPLPATTTTTAAVVTGYVQQC